MADARVATTPFQFLFHDWPPDQGGKPKPTQFDTWLYIFQVSEKSAHLSQEIYIQPAGGNQRETYFDVDLKQHGGKDLRPLSQTARDCCWIDDNSRHVLKDVRYYILCSPFQLPWRRIDKLAKAKDPSKFESLAKEERGLDKVLLDEANTEKGAGSMIRIKAIWSPWGKGQSLSRQYLSRLGEWEDLAMTSQKQQQRAVLSAIDMLRKGRKGGKLVDEEGKSLLDDNFLKEVHKQFMKDDELHAKVADCAKKLVNYFKGPAMTAMEDDAMAVEDIDARENFAEIRVLLESRLSQTPVGREYRQKWFEQRHALVTFDLAAKFEKPFKPLRKGLKAVFNWAKSWADVAAGYPSGAHAGEVPTKLVSWSKKQVKWFLDWDLKVVEVAPGWSAFDKKDVNDLKVGINDNRLFNGLMSLVDAINFAITLRALFESSKGDGLDRSKRIASATSGLCSLMSSLAGYAKQGAQYISPAEIARVKELAVQGELSSNEAMILTEHLSRGRTKSMLSQLNRWKSATKTLGALGAAADTWSNGVEMFAGMHQAKVGDSPDRIWLWPGLGMAGSAVACVGYCLAFSSPAGALLIVAGTVMSLTGAAGGFFWPGMAAGDTNKWLMHSFVGRHRNHTLLETDTYTFNNSLAVYHTRLDLQIRALDMVLFDFLPTCEIYKEGDEPRLKIDVFLRQLRVHSKVRLKVFGKERGRWNQIRHSDDWRPIGAPPEDKRTHTREEMPARLIEGIPAWGFDEMKISVQIDVLGDGTFLYPKDPKEALAKA
jgi:hypothetical protein